jgi:hypothetical protein
VADDGSVRRTELDVDVDGSTTATIRVRFAPDPKLNLLVPELMEEDYRVGAPGRESSISCKAVYSDFRRFETSIRIVD